MKEVRPGPAAARRLRIAGVSSLVLLVLFGGAGALWLSTRASEPKPAVSRGERPSLQPPIRLDTLPLQAKRPRRAEGSGRAERSQGRRPRGAGSGGGDRGEGSGRDNASRSEMKRELTALARENAAIEAALSGDNGPGPGSGEVVWPADGRTIARFGRLFGRLHAGIDIAVPSGTAVHAADAGEVAISDVVGGYGKFVCLQHTGTLSTCYAHNSSLRVSEGDSVDSGDVIARSGCSGRCYADHLHFEVRESGEAVNPKEYLSTRG